MWSLYPCSLTAPSPKDVSTLTVRIPVIFCQLVSQCQQFVKGKYANSLSSLRGGSDGMSMTWSSTGWPSHTRLSAVRSCEDTIKKKKNFWRERSPASENIKFKSSLGLLCGTECLVHADLRSSGCVQYVTVSAGSGHYFQLGDV